MWDLSKYQLVEARQPLTPSWRSPIRFCPVNVGRFFVLQLQGLVRDVTFVMQMGVVEYESVESLLLALINFPAADIAKCPPNLIEKARHLLQSVAVSSPASPQDEEDFIHVTAPSSPPPPRTQDEEGIIHVTVPSSASPPRTQDEESLIHVNVPSSTSPPRTQDEDLAITVSEDVPISNGYTCDPGDANTAAVETKAKELFEALLEAIKETKDLLKQDVKDVIRGDLSPAAYDPRVQDLEAGIGTKPSNAQKLRHIIVLPKWLKAYEDSSLPPVSRGALATFSTEKGLKYSTAREGMFRARRLRYIIRHSGKPGLEVPLGLIMSKWRRLTEEVILVFVRLCGDDSSVTEAMPALLKFYEECDAEYNVLLYQRLAAVRNAVKFGFGASGTSQMHCKWTGGFAEDTEGEEPPIGEGQCECVSGHWNARLSTDGVGCELSTTVAWRNNQHGIKRSFTQFSDDVSLYVTRPSSVCTGSTAGIDA